MHYRLLHCSASIAVIQFHGIFNSRNVIWHAQIQLLRTSPQTKTNFRQFITLIGHKNKLKFIVIGLNLKKITKPDILKTIIMITNYKNLKIGKHEFGELFHY